MKNIAGFALLSVFFFSSCTKGHLPPSKGGEVPCKISRIIFDEDFLGRDTLTFTYNELGNPTFIRRNHPTTGGPNLLFRYDSQNRLIGYLGVFTLDQADRWSKYHYIGSAKRPVSDSMYWYPAPDTGNVLTYFDAVYFNAYQYDAWDRISKVTATLYGNGPGNTPNYGKTVTNYNYDAKGDLIGGAYDNKVNVLRTSSVLQFVSRNYSQHNSDSSSVIDAYNETGLPTHLKAKPAGGPLDPRVGYQFLYFYFKEAWIEYTCACDVKATGY